MITTPKHQHHIHEVTGQIIHKHEGEIILRNAPDNFDLIREYFHIINQKIDLIMATQAEHAQELRDLKAQNDKARQEVLDKIQKLEEALANLPSGTTPEVDEAMADLKSSIQTDDDIVADPTT